MGFFILFFCCFFCCLGVCPGYCPLKQCCHIIPLPAFNGLTFLLDCYICISMHNTVLYKRCHYCYSTLYRYIYEYYTLFHARAVCTQQSALSVTLPFNISEASAWASIIRMCFNTNGQKGRAKEAGQERGFLRIMGNIHPWLGGVKKGAESGYKKMHCKYAWMPSTMSN